VYTYTTAPSPTGPFPPEQVRPQPHGGTIRHMKRAVLVVPLLLLTACGGGNSDPSSKPTTTTIMHGALDAKMKLWAVRQHIVPAPASVQCPSGIPIKAGTDFHCLVRGGGQTVRVTVTIENDKGYLTWTTD
jgi:hypothetical protein